MNKSESLTLLINKLKQSMIAASLWQDDMPSREALLSQQPFCCDTLRFEQWLQFVFIERIEQLIQLGKPLPANFSIAPMAHQCWDLSKPAIKTVTLVLMDIDKLMSGES